MTLKLRRTKNRKYEILKDQELRYGYYPRRLCHPAEYAIFRADELLLRIVLNGGKWRACQPSEKSEIGLAISPIGMNKFREVRKWAFDHLEKE